MTLEEAEKIKADTFPLWHCPLRGEQCLPECYCYQPAAVKRDVYGYNVEPPICRLFLPLMSFFKQYLPK